MKATVLWCAGRAVLLAIALGILAAPGASLASSPNTIGDLMPGFYELESHPDGALGPPLYGLRLDGLGGDKDDEFTFSFDQGGADMLLELAVVNDVYRVRIFGWAYGGQVVNNQYVDPILWTIDFSYETVIESGVNLVSNTTSSTGTLMAKEDGGEFSMGQSFDLREYADQGPTFFIGSGHRGVAGLSGWGWLNHSGTDIDEHVYDSDWLFVIGEKTEPKVPEPAVSVLLGLAMAALAARRV